MPETETPLLMMMLDPKTVAVHPKNARNKLRDIDKLAESMRQVGVLVPVLVKSGDNGDWQLIAGHRRRAAAIEAGVQLPAVPWTGGDDPTIALAMLTENETRDDLSTSEAARAYQNAFDLGVTVEDMAAATGVDAKIIDALATVSHSRVATAVTDRHDLTLDQALVIAEFDDDKDAVKALTALAVKEPHRWDHTVAWMRRARDEKKARDEALAQAEADGVRILTEDDLAQKSKRLPITQLEKANGLRITERMHAKCPGRCVAVVQVYGHDEVVEFCEDPTVNGHFDMNRSRTGGSSTTTDTRTDEQREAESVERRKVRDNNKALDVANGVRIAYEAKLIKSKKRIPGLTEYLCSFVMKESGLLVRTDASVWGTLTGKEIETSWDAVDRVADMAIKASNNDGDYMRALLGFVCAAMESSVDKTTWRHPRPDFAGHLVFLESTGYTLSDIEASIAHPKTSKK